MDGDPKLRTELPCGCWRAVVKRKTPVLNEAGHMQHDEAGEPLFRESEDIEEGYCPEHSKDMVERQKAVQFALDKGADPNEIMKLMISGSPFAPQLAAGDSDDDGEPGAT